MRTTLNRRSFLFLAGGAFEGARASSQVLKPGVRTVSKSIESRCSSYLDAWSRKDLEGIAVYVHPDVHFKAPMQELVGRDAYLAATKRVFLLLERVDVRAQFIAGDRAVLVYDFICRDPIGVSRTAEMLHFEGELIRETELFFDARPFEAMQKTQAARALQK